jgi:hypothetical protein
MALIVIPVLILTPWSNLFDAHLTRADLGVLGLLMLALIVVRDHARLPDGVHAYGHGRVLRMACVPQVSTRTSRSSRCSICSCSARTA